MLCGWASSLVHLCHEMTMPHPSCSPRVDETQLKWSLASQLQPVMKKQSYPGHHKSETEIHSVLHNSLRPPGLYRAGLLCPWNSPGQNTGVGSLSLLQGNLPNLWIESRSPALQADSLAAEPQGKPKNTGVGSLSLLQWLFLTQESNQSLLHCQRILYQLSYEGKMKVTQLCLTLYDPMNYTVHE